MMKPLAIFFVFLVIAGSQAYGPDQTSKVYEWFSYVYGAEFAAAIDSFLMVSGSATARTTLEGLENITQHWNARWEEFPEEVKRLVERAEVVVKGIGKKAYRAAKDLGVQVDLGEPLVAVLSQYLDPVLEKLEPLVKPYAPQAQVLRQTTAHYFEKTLPEKLSALDTELAFYPKQLADTYESLLRPYADQMVTLVRQGAEALNKNLKPYLKPYLVENEKYKEAFRQWVYAPLFPRTSSYYFFD